MCTLSDVIENYFLRVNSVGTNKGLQFNNSLGVTVYSEIQFTQQVKIEHPVY